MCNPLKTNNSWTEPAGNFVHHAVVTNRFDVIYRPVILQIEKPDLYFLYVSISKPDRIFKVIIENKFIELQNRVLQNISSTAQERYQSFLEQYPQLAMRLPNTQIASYLGITPEFLSKIRSERKLG